MNPISTIGYERAPLDQVIDRLHAGGVELVIDVRAVASSRRAGFSKTLLGNSLIAAGDKRACLLCYEDDPACCHRTIVAEAMAARTGARIIHL